MKLKIRSKQDGKEKRTMAIAKPIPQKQISKKHLIYRARHQNEVTRKTWL